MDLLSIAKLAQTIASILPFKGKTQHLSSNDANNLLTPLADKLSDEIYTAVSSDIKQELDSVFSTQAAHAIDSSSWWKAGNDQQGGISKDIRSYPSLPGTLWRVLVWAFRNSPTGNYHDAYYAASEIFNKSLYPILNKNNPELTKLVDGSLATATSQTGGAAIVSGGTTDNILQRGIDAIGNIFSGSGSSNNSTSGVSKAGFNTVTMIILAGLALGLIYNMVKKGNPI